MQERSKRTRSKIIGAAAALIATDGYNSATTDQIARRAGVTTGALYFHFPSKEDVAREVVFEQHRISTEIVAEITARGLSAVNTLTHLSASLGYHIRTEPIVRAGMSLSTETLLLHEVFRQPWLDWIEMVGYLLARGVTEGDVRRDVDTVALGQLIGPAFSGVRIASEILHDSEDLLDRLRDLSIALIPGFAVKSREAGLLRDAHAIFAEYMRRDADRLASA